jgi:cytochrome c oxidase cbb3-type subunit III
MKHFLHERAVLRGSCAASLWVALVVLPHAQNRPAQAPPAQTPGQPPAGGRVPRPSPASQRPPETRTPQSYPPEQVQAGQVRFASECGFCHGRDAAGGETGSDLTRSLLVAEDIRGNKIGPVVRNGQIDKGMPAFRLSDADLIAIVAYIHDQKRKSESLVGDRRSVDVADLQTGNPDAGRRYFESACSRCHSPGGDLAGLATKYQGLALLQRMLYPAGGRGGGPAPKRPTVTVTLRTGEQVVGKLAYRDEFTISMTDASGTYRSWPTSQVKFAIDDPLQAHFDQLGKYTDEDMHNVLAYLQTLR